MLNGYVQPASAQETPTPYGFITPTPSAYITPGTGGLLPFELTQTHVATMGYTAAAPIYQTATAQAALYNPACPVGPVDHSRLDIGYAQSCSRCFDPEETPETDLLIVAPVGGIPAQLIGTPVPDVYDPVGAGCVRPGYPTPTLPPTNTPVPTNTPTPGPSPTATATPTATSTPANTYFLGPSVSRSASFPARNNWEAMEDTWPTLPYAVAGYLYTGSHGFVARAGSGINAWNNSSGPAGGYTNVCLSASVAACNAVAPSAHRNAPGAISNPLPAGSPGRTTHIEYEIWSHGAFTWTYTMQIIGYGVPPASTPSPTNTPSPTPTATSWPVCVSSPTPGPSATPRTGFDGPLLGTPASCYIPRYVDQSPMVNVGSLQSGVNFTGQNCYRVVPYVHIPIPEVQAGGLTLGAFHIDDVDLCIQWFEFPQISLLGGSLAGGIDFKLDWFLFIPILWLVRRLLQF